MAGDPMTSTTVAPRCARRRRSRAARRARTALAALLVAPLLVPAAAAERGDVPIVELPPAACDVCTPGKPPPPPEVQERVRRLNQHANWRRQPSTGDTIPLGTATRIWLQRAWASGRLQPGVANPGGGVARSGAGAFRGGMRAQSRTSLASRSRARLADRRSTRDEGRRGRSRRGDDDAASSRTSRGLGGSGFGTGSGLGTNRSSSTFGDLGGAGGSSGMSR
jgi:hypothetical protein